MKSNVAIDQQLESMFHAPLGDFASRRIVIWHDPDGEFADEFAGLAGGDGLLDGLLERPVHCVDVHDGNTFETRLDVCRRLRGDDFLLYRRRPHAQLDGDWFADVELYAEHFQADYLSLLIQDLGADDSPEVRASLQQMKAFFASKERVGRFKKAMPEPHGAGDIVRGVLAVVFGAPEAGVARSIIAFLMKRDEAAYNPAAVDDVLARLEKFGAREPFARLVRSAAGYEGELEDLDALGAHLLVTALAATMPATALAGLEAHLSAGNAQLCLGIVREWASSRDENEMFVLHDLCRTVEEELHLARRFADMPLDQLLDSDVFPSIDEAILGDLMGSLAQGSDRRAEAKRVVQTRRDMAWREPMAPFYDCVAAAVEIQDFQRTHAGAFAQTSTQEIWRLYTEDWWRMDAAYRAFLDAFARCISMGVYALEDKVRELADWVDRAYAQWFLTGSNSAWVAASKDAWETRGFVDGIPLQRRFFDDTVASELHAAKRVMVIISDGMRYEVARQLAEQLERETRGQASVSAMQSVFPSITQFGMAALLPHRHLAYSEATGEVSADGRPTKTLEDRQSVLRERVGASAAIRYGDLLKMGRADRKRFASDLELVYVYHNVIDAAGHGETSGQGVFDACGDAVRDIVALVRIAINDMGIGRVLVTSDHGFLFTRADIPEMDQASRGDVAGRVRKVERRFLIAEPDASSELFVNMDMEDVDGGAYTWWAPRDCVRIKCPGSKNYVHGGVSLQELCVPVLRFRNLRSGAKGYVEKEFAQIQLLSTSRRITTAVFFVELYQKDRVADKVLPCDYELVLTDSSGNEVSDRCLVRADNPSAQDADRRMKARLSLKSGRAWSASEAYFLVARNTQTGETCWTEQYSIEIAFAPSVDFGF